MQQRRFCIIRVKVIVSAIEMILICSDFGFWRRAKQYTYISLGDKDIGGQAMPGTADASVTGSAEPVVAFSDYVDGVAGPVGEPNLQEPAGHARAGSRAKTAADSLQLPSTSTAPALLRPTSHRNRRAWAELGSGASRRAKGIT